MKTRSRHTWEPNKSNAQPQRVIFVDVETVPVPRGKKFEKHVLKLGWACYTRPSDRDRNHKPQWFYFTEVAAFWDFVKKHLRAKTKLYIVGHRVGYDMGVLQVHRTAKSEGWTETLYYEKGAVLILKYTTGKGTIEILSSTNFFAMSLRDLGQMVGLEKGEVDFKTVSDSELREYCKRDVEVVMRGWDTWLKFLTDHDLGAFKPTLAGQAFAAYRHRFMKQAIWVHNDMEACQLERDSYRGGRCEVFCQGEFITGDYYKLDVNGLYGHVMATCKLPFDLYGRKGEVSVDFLRQKLKKYAVIARVVINTEIPVFPVKHNGVNCYPVGTFETVLTTPELKFALEHCEITAAEEIAWYVEDYILRDFAIYFGALKSRYSKSGCKAFRTIAKLFNNALYGKLAQRDLSDLMNDRVSLEVEGGLKTALLTVLPRRVIKTIKRAWGRWGEVVWGNTPPPEHDPNLKAKRVEPWSLWELLGKKPKMHYSKYVGERPRHSKTTIKPQGWVSKAEALDRYGESYNSFPCISAHITAYARLYLWDLMAKAGRENVFYCDTDCIITNRQGYENLKGLLHGHKQGRLKVEDKGRELTIWRRKGYVINGKRTISGIREDAVEVEPLVFEQDEFLGSAGATREGNPDLRGVTRVVKRVGTEIKGGIVGEDGWVTPFRFPL